MYDNLSLCQKCGGECCKNFPGCVLPSKDNPTEQARKLLASGYYTLDWWIGDPRHENSSPCVSCPDGMKCDSDECQEHKIGWIDRAYYIRSKMQDEEGLFNAGWGRVPCVFWTEKGCKLPSNERPDECQLLEPSTENCIMHDGASKKDCCLAWLNSGVDLYEIATELLDKLEKV